MQNLAFAPGQRFTFAVDPDDIDAPLRTPKDLAVGYDENWAALKVSRDWLTDVDTIIDKVFLRNQGRYQDISRRTDATPWFVIAIIHFMEASGRFDKHLHNGDPLTARTRLVPAGRPLRGNPPFTFEESAVDALGMKSVPQIDDWSVASICYLLESYNGFGYRNKGIRSPYLYAQSNLWSKGKYVADGRYDPNAGSSQIGAVCFLKRMFDRGIISAANAPIPTPTKPVREDKPDLKFGDTGIGVEVLQNTLNGCGYGPLEVDGEFGPATLAEVRAFQDDLGLDIDGEVGPLTWAALGQHAKLPGWTPVYEKPSTPIADPSKGDLRKLVATQSEALARLGRSHSPGNEIDKTILDPLRPAMKALGHLGASQNDDFWNWCAGWVTFCLRQAGVNVPDKFKAPGCWATVALVEMWDVQARACGAWIPRGTRAPKQGDVVIFDWDGDRYADHIGIFLRMQGGYFVCAEGNRGNREAVTQRSLSSIEGFIDLEKLAAHLGMK
jgi:lysozyme family protein